MVELIFYKTNHHSDEYGIDAFDDNNLVKTVCGITDIKTDAEKLVNLFNELEIELCHFDDIIEDYLTDFEI